jgi:DNA helicase II / ATP-dependent DNA helicase PcrA
VADSLLYGLNDRQREAVLHDTGPLVIFAGAGSGKTRVITHRVAQLVSARGVQPWRILAVTFTNKAAAEMRERLQGLLPGGARELWVGTFHAICARLLRRHAELAGIRRDFVIYDDADQRAMITRIARDMGLDDRRYNPRQVAGVINRAKNEAIGPADFSASDEFERVVQQLYVTYEARMAQSGALDFGDLIYRLVALMATNAELLQQVQGLYEHVLVDEYQDTNRVQYLLLRGLTARHDNLCVVGDDDQSIYRFRGADRRNILEFTRQFPRAKLVKLEQNYRSTQRILRVANGVVGRNLHRESKALWTENEQGSKVTVLSCEDERDEAAMLVKLMRMLLEAGHARRELAVLYRTHALSRVIEEALRFANLPYRVVGGLRFYDRAEVKDLLAYLRVVHNPDDDVSLLRVINTPPRGIGKTTVERLLDSAARSGGSVWQALREVEHDPAHSSAARKSLERFTGLVQMLRQMVVDGRDRPAELARAVLDQTGYAQTLKDEDSAEADARLENLQEVLGSMVEFEQEAEEPTLSAFLELVTLQTDADRQQDDDAITLMTVHAAKGLEFPVVMVAGLEEETFPHRGMAPEDDPDDLEEERRLAYVAFTRARQRLFLSHAQLRRVYGEMRYRTPSRFFDEMPQDELERVGGRVGERSRPANAAGSRYGVPTPRQSPPASRFASPRPAAAPLDSHVDPFERSEMSDMEEGIELRLGMRVRHKKFGVGQVRSVTPGTPPRVTVAFPGWGDKTLVSSYLEPA